ncbi:MAG TPA: hypothetical protein VKT33_00755 [Candidatus Angelobacter sp.]|nr:hypothetical protein [Candidatus Angelobacter sp.]
MKNFRYGFFMLCAVLTTNLALADTLELRNGSVIKGTYVGGNENQISFRVGSSVQQYDVNDVATLRFESQPTQSDRPAANRRRDRDNDFASRNDKDSDRDRDRDADRPQASAPSDQVTVASGTRLVVRMTDAIDSSKNNAGDKFSATLDQALYVDNVLVAARGTQVYGRLDAVQQAGHISGRSQLKLSLTGIVINGQTIALTTGDYALSGKSRGTNTAQKVGGGAAVGALIGALAGGGKGAAIGAGVGAGAGGAVQVATHGERINIPSETLLEFAVDQPFSIPAAQNSDR